MATSYRLQDGLDRIAKIQSRFLATGNSAMKANDPYVIERTNAVRAFAADLQTFLPQISESTLDGYWKIDFGGAQGIASPVAWIRIFDGLAPSATKGWYLVFLVKENGEGSYLSMAQGVTSTPLKIIQDEVARARTALNIVSSGIQPGDIGHSNKAKQYESCIAKATFIKSHGTTRLADNEFISLVDQMLNDLNKVRKTAEALIDRSREMSEGDDLVFRTQKWTGEFLESRAGEKFTGLEIAENLVRLHPRAAEEKRLASTQNLSESGLVEQIKQEVNSRYSTGGLTNQFPQILVTNDSPRRYYWPSEAPKREERSTRPSDNEYDLTKIQDEGSFLDIEELRKAMNILKSKKNLILQGPPGTGKTWLAKKLAFALIGEADPQRIISMQFHANMSYEDFVRGWRPQGDGKLQLVDGPFLEMVEKAISDPNQRYVFLIEELNRGNPAQIFGEMLTLLERDKRSSEHSLRLTYVKESGEAIFIPENLHVIGTMNLADRSLSLMDFAFRRRFGFLTLKPEFNRAWESWLESFGVSKSSQSKIKSGMQSLNQEISSDQNLGSSYAIGHSYFTPTTDVSNENDWLALIIESEIKPTLEEYWFDQPTVVEREIAKLKATLLK